MLVLDINRIIHGDFIIFHLILQWWHSRHSPAQLHAASQVAFVKTNTVSRILFLCFYPVIRMSKNSINYSNQRSGWHCVQGQCSTEAGHGQQGGCVPCVWHLLSYTHRALWAEFIVCIPNPQLKAALPFFRLEWGFIIRQWPEPPVANACWRVPISLAEELLSYLQNKSSI